EPSRRGTVLMDYARGTLSPAERSRLETHLARCEDCRFLVADMSAPLSDALQSAGEAAFVTPKRSGRRPIAVAVGVTAVAAAVLLTVLPTAEPLPRYSLTALSGGVAETRGAVSHRETFGPSGVLRFALRPDRDARTTVSASAWVEEATQWRKLPSTMVQVQDNGAVQFSGAVSAFGVTGGRVAVLLGVEPFPGETLSKAAAKRLDNNEWHTIGFRIQGDSDG
ncbi:MAG: zf-HC2 domain-containing protein, partial [Myxococcota bacterium]